MSRIWVRWAVLLTLLAWAGAAAAQTQSTAPTTDTGTKLSFPATLGGAQLERSVNYAAPPANQPGQGHSYFYSTPKKMVISVHVYDGGRRVPPGSDNPTVVAEFAKELETSEQQSRFAGYSNFERPSVSSTCVYGSARFRCISYSAATQFNTRLYSKVLMTGYRDHFVRIRIEWWPMRQQTAADADAALQAFVPALMH